ncbi:MAG: hypothetical protein LIP06_15460 [Tannerellaceae bacterium]|nr:hypothetical protein [Tannerellaceae bacterium]
MAKELIKNRRLVEEYNTQIIENEQIIENNRKLLAQKDIELHEAKERVDENEKLEVQNQLLKEMVRKKEKVYKQYLEKHKNEYLEEHQELHLRYNRLRRRKEILLEQVIRKNDLLLWFKNAPETKEKFSEKDLEEFLEIINKLYDGFANRLKSKYEELTQDEIIYCCLLKIKMKPNQIAAILGITHDNVYKRKQRIKDRVKPGKIKLEDLLYEMELEE